MNPSVITSIYTLPSMADDMFAGLKKKSKKGSSKKIDLLEVDEGETPSGESIVPPKGEDPVRPEEASADLTLPEEEPLDFSDLKKVGHTFGTRADAACMASGRSGPSQR